MFIRSFSYFYYHFIIIIMNCCLLAKARSSSARLRIWKHKLHEDTSMKQSTKILSISMNM